MVSPGKVSLYHPNENIPYRRISAIAAALFAALLFARRSGFTLLKKALGYSRGR